MRKNVRVELIANCKAILDRINTYFKTEYYLEDFENEELTNLNTIKASNHFLEGCKYRLDCIDEARKVVPESVWKNYELLGITGLQEQIQLTAAEKEFWRYFVDYKPVILKKMTEKKKLKLFAEAQLKKEVADEVVQVVTKKAPRKRVGTLNEAVRKRMESDN